MVNKPIDPQKYTKEYFLTDCDGYDLFIKSHGTEIPCRQAEFYKRILLTLKPEEKILEIGCGRGELCAALSIHASYVTGIDYSGAAIELCTNTYKGKFDNLSFMVADAKTLPFPNNSFSLVICTEVLEHLHQWELEKMMSEVCRVLEYSGRFAAQTEPNNIFRYVSSIWSFFPRLILGLIKGKKTPILIERPPGHIQFHVNELSFWSLKKMLKAFFIEYKIETFEMTLSMNNLQRFFFNAYPFNKIPLMGRFCDREIMVFCNLPIKR